MLLQMVRSLNLKQVKIHDTAKIKQFAEFYSLYNNPFSIRFNKNGEVLEVYKADKISNKFLEIKGAADHYLCK